MLNQIDLSRVDLNLLVLFEVVMEERHVGRAAERLRLSPSAVSHGLGRLRRLLQDPLFLRNPKGVAPTERAAEVAAPIADILARTRGVLASAEPFDPARSSRRFVIAGSDGTLGVLAPRLIAATAQAAPRVRFGFRDLLPRFETAFEGLDAREFDIAVAPLETGPDRFVRRPLFKDDFVIAMRRGHKLGKRLTLESYCAARHVLVSYGGDPHGFMDQLLAERGLRREVALTVPSFLAALSAAAASDFLTAAPARLAEEYAVRLGLVLAPAPLPVTIPTEIAAFASRAAMVDAGVAWLMALLERSAGETRARQPEPRRAGSRSKR
jgi:DNA-binding transcriptional LysR family regulator